MELIAVVAAAHPGPGERYNLRQSDAVIRRYLKAARKAKALLILDIQPGRSDFFTETKRLRKWLKEPDVGLALDPEWRMAPGQIPGKVIGSVGAREVNATTAWLDQLVTRYKLPQKLLLIHQFTDDMVPENELKERKGLAYVLNVDGFGTQALKVAKYKSFAAQAKQFRRGFKLFYEEDLKMMTPAQVMRLNPRPDVIVYEYAPFPRISGRVSSGHSNGSKGGDVLMSSLAEPNWEALARDPHFRELVSNRRRFVAGSPGSTRCTSSPSWRCWASRRTSWPRRCSASRSRCGAACRSAR